MYILGSWSEESVQIHKTVKLCVYEVALLYWALRKVCYKKCLTLGHGELRLDLSSQLLNYTEEWWVMSMLGYY